MKRIALLMLLAAVTSCSQLPEKQPEICSNGIDDDKNGLTDCSDPDCSGQAGCPVTVTDGGPNLGTCKNCGKVCSQQSECLTVDYQNDTPLPECVNGKCQRLNSAVQVHYEVDTASLTGFPPPLRSLNTRIVSKVALDGGATTCLTVRAQAMGKAEADANQIERSAQFNLRGYDVSPLQASGGEIIKQPFVNIGTGTDFLIWTEVWGGQVLTGTKLPSGNRYAWGCFEAGPAVAEVVATDHCSSAADAGPCRTIRVKLVNGPE